MKKLFLFFLVSSLIIAQENTSKSIMELKYAAVGMRNDADRISGEKFNITNDNSLIQNPMSDINYEVSGIQDQPTRKNPGLAILYSLLLPGMGELYAGDYSSGKYFTIADGVLWGVYIGFQTYGNWKMDNYKSFAQTNAGVNVNGKESDYFANVGIYISVDEYNRIQDLNRDYNQAYNSNKFYWKWSSESQRVEYRQMWSSSESAFNNVRFAAGALILNRLISAINAVRLVSAHNKNIPVETSWNMSMGVDNKPTLPTSITFNFVKTF